MPFLGRAFQCLYNVNLYGFRLIAPVYCLNSLGVVLYSFLTFSLSNPVCSIVYILS